MKKELATKKTMTTKEVAKALGVSTDTVKNCIRRIMPNKMQSRKATFLNESEVAAISKELKNNRSVLAHQTGEVTSSVMATVTRQELVNNVRQAQEAFNNAMLALVEDLQSENNMLQITLDYSKEWASVKRMEFLNPNRKFDWRVLKAKSAEIGVEIRKAFDRNYGEVNAYHKTVWESCYELDEMPWE